MVVSGLICHTEHHIGISGWSWAGWYCKETSENADQSKCDTGIRMLLARRFFHFCGITTTSWHGNLFRISAPSVAGGFTSQRPVMWGFDASFVVSLNKLSNKQSNCQLSETPWRTVMCSTGREYATNTPFWVTMVIKKMITQSPLAYDGHDDDDVYGRIHGENNRCNDNKIVI